MFFMTILLLTGFLVACTPIFSPDVIRQADETISPKLIQQDPEAYIGKIFLWGGVIFDTINTQDGTILRVMQTQLDFHKKPVHTTNLKGTFLKVISSDFLEPEIFMPGRKITVAGKFIGIETAPFG